MIYCLVAMTKSLGKMIKEARLAKGWTQEELAAKLGKKYITIYRQESDKDEFGDDTLKKACNLLGLDYRQMLALKHPNHAAVFREQKTLYDSQTKKAIDKAQERGYKNGGIPKVLPDGIIQRLGGGGPYRSIRAVRQAYEELKSSDPAIAVKCEICELLESGEISDEQLVEVLRFIRFTASKETKPE